MTDVRDAADVLSAARTGKPVARASPRPAQRSPAPRRPAAPAERARPAQSYVEEGRPLWMERMQIPLSGLSEHVLAQLERLGRGYEGWGREGDYDEFFVDVGGKRYRGPSLQKAIAAAFGGAR